MQVSSLLTETVWLLSSKYAADSSNGKTILAFNLAKYSATVLAMLCKDLILLNLLTNDLLLPRMKKCIGQAFTADGHFPSSWKVLRKEKVTGFEYFQEQLTQHRGCFGVPCGPASPWSFETLPSWGCLENAWQKNKSKLELFENGRQFPVNCRDSLMTVKSKNSSLIGKLVIVMQQW